MANPLGQKFISQDEMIFKLKLKLVEAKFLLTACQDLGSEKFGPKLKEAIEEFLKDKH